MNNNQSPANKSDQSPGTHDVTKSDKVATPMGDTTDWCCPTQAEDADGDYSSTLD